LLRNVVRLCLRHRLLPSLVGQSPWLDRRAPSLCPHYQASSLLRARPPLHLASVLGSLWVFHLECSLRIEVPGSHVPHSRLLPSSRRLYAGPRLGSTQVYPRLRHRPTTGAWFRGRPYAFDTSSAVHSRSSSWRSPDGLWPAFSRNAHHVGSYPAAACGGLGPAPASRPRGAFPHRLYSLAASSHHLWLLSAPSWRTIIRITNHDGCFAIPSRLEMSDQVGFEAVECDIRK
jgi:hypothetical protein